MLNRAASVPAPPNEKISEIVLSHFDAHQRPSIHAETAAKLRRYRSQPKPTASDIHTRSALLRKEIANAIEYLSSSREGNNDGENQTAANLRNTRMSVADDAKVEVTRCIITCTDTVIFKLTSNENNGKRGSPGCWGESCERIFELAASMSCDVGDGYAAAIMISRAGEYSAARLDSVRVKGCYLLGLCLKFIMEMRGSAAAAVICDSPTGFKRDDLQGSNSSSCNDEWRLECASKIQKLIIPRLRDKSQAVRQAAIKCCKHFFASQKQQFREDAEERFGRVVAVMLWNTKHDPSFANRLTTLRSLPLNEETIEVILSRVRDVKDKVRVEALNVLMEKVDVNDLTDEQRSDVLRYGLTERCAATNAATIQMLCCGWMKSAGFNPIALIQLLDPSTNEKECENAIRVIIAAAEHQDDENDSPALSLLSDPERRAFKKEVLGATKNIFTENDNSSSTVTENDDSSSTDVVTETGTPQSVIIPDPSAALYLRIRCILINESTRYSLSTKSTLLSELIPDVTVLCTTLLNHINRYAQSTQKRAKHVINCHAMVEDFDEEAATFEDGECFISLQLLQLVCVTEFAEEEGSRRYLLSALGDMLIIEELPHDLIEGCVRAMANVYGKNGETDFVTSVIHALEEIDKLEGAGEQGRRLRQMAILSVFLENLTRRVVNNSQFGCVRDYIISAVTCSNAFIRESGVSCLGKLVLVSEEDVVLNEYKPLLLKIATNEKEKEEIRAQALLSICDMALLFNRVLLPSDDSCEDSISESVVSVITELLSQQKSETLMVIAAETCVKLSFAGKLIDSKILARLLMIYFNLDYTVENDEDVDEVKVVGSPIRLQQLFSLFFPAFAAKCQNKKWKDAMLGSIPLLLYLIHESITANSRKRKRTSVLKYPVGKMIDYICVLLDDAAAAVLEYQQADATENSQAVDKDGENRSPADGDTKNSTKEISTKITAIISVCQFINDNSYSMSVAFLRNLCKYVGDTCVDINATSSRQLYELKQYVNQSEWTVDDKVASRSLKSLSEQLEDLEEVEDDDVGENQELIESFANMTDLSEERDDGKTDDVDTTVDNIMFSELHNELPAKLGDDCKTDDVDTTVDNIMSSELDNEQPAKRGRTEEKAKNTEPGTPESSDINLGTKASGSSDGAHIETENISPEIKNVSKSGKRKADGKRTSTARKRRAKEAVVLGNSSVMNQ